MPGIPVRVVTNGGIPVRSVAKGRGIPAYVDSRSAFSVRIVENGWYPPFYIEGLEPPIDFDFQEFSMTAGTDGVQWVGYSTGLDNTPNPPFGSIQSQPTDVTTLLAFYDDTASGVFLAVFDGEYASELQGLQLSVGGYVVDSFDINEDAGNTWVRFNGIPGDLVAGGQYEVTFGFDLPRVPAPAFTTQPSISGSPQVGQVLTGTDGTGTNYTTYSRQWLRGSTAISGATGSNYTLTTDDIGFNISRRDTLTGTTAPPAVATTNAIGPVTAAPVAPTLVGGTMTQDGPDVVFTQPTASGNPNPTVTFVVTRDGTDVTSSIVANRITAAPDGNYVATWTATNGVSPDAVRMANLTVESGEVPWTLEDIPAEYRINGGLWEAQNAQIVNTNQVASVPDTWSVRDMVQATTGGQPYYGDRNGFPAVVWPDTTGNRHLRVAANFQPVYWIFVAAYNTGALTTFSGAATILMHDTSNRVIGNPGTNSLVQTVGTTWARELSKNAGAYSATVLPMPMGLVEVQGPAVSGRWTLGSTVSNSSWQGPMWLAMALGTVPTGNLLARIQGYLAWRYNLQGSLPAGHPYKNAPPNKNDPGPSALMATPGGFMLSSFDEEYTLTPEGEGFTMESTNG